MKRLLKSLGQCIVALFASLFLGILAGLASAGAYRGFIHVRVDRCHLNHPGTMSAIKSFLKRLFCRHKIGTLIDIDWDGASIYRCNRCGKEVTKP